MSRDGLRVLDRVRTSRAQVDREDLLSHAHGFRRDLDEFVDSIIDGDPGRVLSAVAFAVQQGRDARSLGEELIRHLREDKYLPIAVIRRLLESPAAARDLVAYLRHASQVPLPGEGPPPFDGEGKIPGAVEGESLRIATVSGCSSPRARSDSSSACRYRGSAAA